MAAASCSSSGASGRNGFCDHRESVRKKPELDRKRAQKSQATCSCGGMDCVMCAHEGFFDKRLAVLLAAQRQSERSVPVYHATCLNIPIDHKHGRLLEKYTLLARRAAVPVAVERVARRHRHIMTWCRKLCHTRLTHRRPPAPFRPQSEQQQVSVLVGAAERRPSSPRGSLLWASIPAGAPADLKASFRPRPDARTPAYVCTYSGTNPFLGICR